MHKPCTYTIFLRHDIIASKYTPKWSTKVSLGGYSTVAIYANEEGSTKITRQDMNTQLSHTLSFMHCVAMVASGGKVLYVYMHWIHDWIIMHTLCVDKIGIAILF